MFLYALFSFSIWFFDKYEAFSVQFDEWSSLLRLNANGFPIGWYLGSSECGARWDISQCTGNWWILWFCFELLRFGHQSKQFGISRWDSVANANSAAHRNGKSTQTNREEKSNSHATSQRANMLKKEICWVKAKWRAIAMCYVYVYVYKSWCYAMAIGWNDLWIGSILQWRILVCAWMMRIPYFAHRRKIKC